MDEVEWKEMEQGIIKLRSLALAFYGLRLSQRQDIIKKMGLPSHTNPKQSDMEYARETFIEIGMQNRLPELVALMKEDV